MIRFSGLMMLGNGEPNEFRGENGEDMLIGDDNNDILSGGGGNDSLLGGGGTDYMLGGNGRDIMYGGSGNDVLYGGSGSDYLCGDAGSDRLIGGKGRDIFAFDVAGELLGDGVDRVHDFVVGVDRLAIVNGSASEVTFANEGGNLAMYYDGVKIATFDGLAGVHLAPNVFVGDMIHG